MISPDIKLKVGDLVTRRNDGRLGIVMSEAFDFLHNELAVKVLTRHFHTGEEGIWTWQLEDIEVLSECQ